MKVSGFHTIRREFGISYSSDEVGIKLLGILVDYFNEKFQNSVLNCWINTIKLILKKGTHKTGSIHIFVDNYFDKGYTELIIEMSLGEVIIDNLQERKKKGIKKSAKHCHPVCEYFDCIYDYYKHYYEHYYEKRKKSFNSELKITLDNKVSFAWLRKLIFEKILKDEKVYEYIHELRYGCYGLIEITGLDIVNAHMIYGYNKDNFGDYYVYYEFAISNDFENKDLKKLYPVKLLLSREKIWGEEKFNKIYELVKYYLDEYKQSDSRTPFRMIREAIRLKNTWHVIEFLL